MQKIYVLLRNNQQTGPYSLPELLQFDLKPYDLIWIEGKSAGWYYPQEIGALHPYLPFLPQKQKPLVSTATHPAYGTPPPVKKEAPQTVPPAATTVVANKVESLYQPSSKNLEDAVYAQFVQPAAQQTAAPATTVSQKKKSPPAGMVALATILVVGGVFAASWVMNRHTSEESVAPLQATAQPVQNEMTTTAVATNNTRPNLPGTTQPVQHQRGIAAKPAAKARQATAVKQNPGTAATAAAKQPGLDDAPVAPGEEAPATSQEEAATTEKQPAAPQEKRKSLRDKVFDLFKKKRAEEKTEDAKPADTENGGRQAKRRDDGTNLAKMVSVRFDVPNSWMMGIKGAKAIVVNRSNETVAKATLEILYYNDDNELLQKKVVNVTNVDGKDSKTISIPDHPTATKLEYTLLSVEGKPAA